MLLAIIENNSGIKTSDIAIKMGTSSSTVKRMLVKLSSYRIKNKSLLQNKES